MPKYKINFISIGSILFLISLLNSLVGYFTHLLFLHYFSFFTLLASIIILLLSIKKDLHNTFNSNILSYLFILFFVGVYVYYHSALPQFLFSVLDASQYYTAGVSAILKENDIGFFLPLTSALSATGFVIFGYDYGISMLSMAYFPSTIFIYYIFKKFGLSTILSFIMMLFFISMPLNIWISKTSFSEPLWQTLLLCFIVISYLIYTHKKISTLTYASLLCILFLLPFSRGESPLIYAGVFVLSLSYLYKYNNLKNAFILLSTLGALTIAIYITTQIRSSYLLQFQFSRIIPGITAEYLLIIMFGVFLLLSFGLVLFTQIKKSLYLRWFPASIIIFLFLFKIISTYILSVKQHSSFVDLLIMNEYSFMLVHFGTLLSIAIVLGITIMFVKALRGDTLTLLLMTLYVLLSIPFMMQDCTANKEHEFFLYWSRYYFSFILVIHVFAIGILFKSIDDFCSKHIKNKFHLDIIMALFILSTWVFSINTNLYTLVIKEAYLQNSQRIFPWLSHQIGNQSLSIVYATDIKYRNYGVKRLMKKGFYVTGIHIKYYRQVIAKAFDKKLKLPKKTFHSNYILCLSQKGCSIESNQVKLISSIKLPISWITDNQELYKKKKLQLNAYLFSVNSLTFASK